MFQTDLVQRVLFRAVEIVGSHDRLARHLQVPASDLLSWMNGNGTPPRSVFLSCVDLIMDEDDADIADLFPEDAPPRRPRRHSH